MIATRLGGIGAVGICLLLVVGPVVAADELAGELRSLVERHEGEVAVVVRHLDTGAGFAYRADEPMPTASLIKFPVMVEAYRQAAEGRLQLDELVTLREEDKVPGSGILTTHFSPGLQLSLRDAIRLMIVYSDNTATNLVLDKIGLAATAESMEQLGLPNTKLHAKVFRGETSVFPERSREFGLGSTTAAEMVRLFEMLQREQLVDADACRQMLDHLLRCDDRDKLARHLPSGVKLAHKSGAVSAARCDAGIIFSPAGPIAVCVLTRNNGDRSWTADNAASTLCAEVARVAYEYFNPAAEPATVETPVELAVGASGKLVEMVQRTLNARLAPSPDLAIDGDFGPQTEAAVLRFQQSRQLTADGRINRATWEALGPLIDDDTPVPDPETVNAEVLERQPPDPLDGPPLVTCPAWAIADAESGELLWSERADERRDIASTTKIMTAYILLRDVAQRPELLDQEVVFSNRADQTVGLTAGVAAGERLPLRECLYGLLLPSGNDASVALAEHWSQHIAPRADVDAPAPADDPLERFVAEMNRTAEQLGMHATHYKNPHGLTAADHKSTAADLVRLARAAWQLDAFRDYVGTRQRGATLTGAGGYQRNVVWRNTNRLLGIEGYVGIKTGTTGAAGACLVSTGNRNDDRLLVVVLGSKSSDARYVDTRNLYRWAWQQRGHEH